MYVVFGNSYIAINNKLIHKYICVSNVCQVYSYFYMMKVPQAIMSKTGSRAYNVDITSSQLHGKEGELDRAGCVHNRQSKNGINRDQKLHSLMCSR